MTQTIRERDGAREGKITYVVIFSSPLFGEFLFFSIDHDCRTSIKNTFWGTLNTELPCILGRSDRELTFITRRCLGSSGVSWMDNCHLLVELKGISTTFGFFCLIDSTEPIINSQHLRSADSEASPAVLRLRIGPSSPARNTARLQRAAMRPRFLQVLSS